MASTFDHTDRNSWYFQIGRQEATDILLAEKENGVFLIRDSASSVGDFVLCVKEDSKVSHYIINRTQHRDEVRYRIGDQVFTDLPSLLAFYRVHYLDTVPLIRPATKVIERVMARYDFDGQDSDDLKFRKGDILTIVSKDEEQWWTAVNSEGNRGSIPVPYVQKLDDDHIAPNEPAPDVTNAQNQPPAPPQNHDAARRYQRQRQLPAQARVIQARVPNAYDETALRLEVGDIITVTRTNINGQWEGELNGRTGHFPFTFVEFLDNDGPNEL